MKGKIAAWSVLGAALCLSSCGGTNTSQYTPPPSSAPDGLSYPDPNMFTQGVAINPLVPTLAKGTATSYWVTPDLPPGLRLESDGKISGTPSAPKASATYLVTAGNSTGTSSFGVRITVHGRFTISGLVSGLTGTGLVLTNNGGDDLAITADGPFTFATALPAASAFSVAVAVQPTGQTCSVSAGGGFLTNDNYGQVAVICSAVVQKAGLSGAPFTDVVRALARDTSGVPQITCATSLLGDALYEFDVDSAGAQVYTALGIPLPGCAPDLVAVDPDGLWLSVTDTAAQTVSVYTVK